jgi:hypothetical protein
MDILLMACPLAGPIKSEIVYHGKRKKKEKGL